MKATTLKRLHNTTNLFFKSIGVCAFLMLVLAFTDIPYFAYHQLSLSDQQLEAPPDVIIVMGGDGMPSPQGLMRLYYGAEMAKNYPNAKILLAMPEAKEDSLNQLQLMKQELASKGINSNRLIFETSGFNTHSQVVAISKLLPKTNNLLVVSSPEHIYRTVRSLEKVGFSKVGSLPTFENPTKEKYLRNKNKKSINQIDNLSLRYNVWSYLQYEIKVLREYFAILYYKLKGWI